ncbi:MAG: hypothetical protein ABFD91_18325 [Anaerohalosphaeraceae bacterium]
MKSDFWFDQIPLWCVLLMTVVAVLISIWIGTLLGQRRRSKPDHEEDTSLGTIIGATMGLLAFMLAFTFGMAADRFQTRKQLLLDEVNVIGTTYLRAGLLLEPHRSQVRSLLSDYVDIRINLAKENVQSLDQKLAETKACSEVLHFQMWSHAMALAEADRSSEIDALFISSLNEMIHLHNSRITVLMYHIPSTIWYVLYFITILSMAIVGYQVGLSGKSVIKVSIVLALVFSSVVLLIADLDRAAEGSLRVSQEPLLELQKKIQRNQGQANPQGKVEMHLDNRVGLASQNYTGMLR